MEILGWIAGLGLVAALLVMAGRGLDRGLRRRACRRLIAGPVDRAVPVDVTVEGDPHRVLLALRVQGRDGPELRATWSRVRPHFDPLTTLLTGLVEDAAARLADREGVLDDAGCLAVVREALVRAGLEVIELRIAGRVRLDEQAARLRAWDVVECVTGESSRVRTCNALDFYLDGVSGIGALRDAGNGPNVRSTDAVADPGRTLWVTRGGDPVSRSLRQMMESSE